MTTITDRTEIEAAFDKFEANKFGAQPTSRLIPAPNQDSSEWKEDGEIDGCETRVYYMFSSEEETEEADMLPWDAEHITHIEIEN